jgi:hypothetical protein
LTAFRKPWIERFMMYEGRTIPVAATVLKRSDTWGGIKARWGVGRMDYSVLPGLYAIGSPTAAAPVFVTANNKLSFDALRPNLAGLNFNVKSIRWRLLSISAIKKPPDEGRLLLVFKTTTRGRDYFQTPLTNFTAGSLEISWAEPS